MRPVWSRDAQNDVFNIGEHYDTFDPDLANTIIARLEEAVTALAGSVALGAMVDDLPGVRKWRAPRTPFVLLYEVVDNRVEILRVVHGASDWRP